MPLNVLVFGSCVPSLDKQREDESPRAYKSRKKKYDTSPDLKLFKEACSALGTALANDKRIGRLLVCSAGEYTADRHVGTRFMENARSGSIAAYVSDTDPHYSQEVDAAFKDKAKIAGRGVDWRLVHLNAINDASIIIALGGGPSTKSNVFSAEALGKPVLALDTFGGAAKETSLYFRQREEFGGRRELPRILPYKQDDKTHTEKWARSVVDAAVDLQKHGVIAERKRDQTKSLVCSVIAFVIWISLYFDPPAGVFGEVGLFMAGLHSQLPECCRPEFDFRTTEEFPLWLTFAFMMLSATVCGSALRYVLTEIGLIGIGRSRITLLRSAIAGLLMGFGLFVLANALGRSVNAEPVAMKTPEQLTHLSGYWSPIFLLCPVFVEDTWNRLSQKWHQFNERD